jgi:hypothetical protein
MPVPDRRRILIALAVAVVLPAVLAPTMNPGAAGSNGRPPAARKLPARFYGVIPQLERPRSDYRRMKRGGVDSVRFPIPWDAVERQRGSYDFSLIDRYVARVARARLEIFPALNATPSFYGADFRSLPVRTAGQRRAWRAFLRAVVRRYGPRGRFWATHRGIPRRPIRRWQIWNEENYFFFTVPRSPKLYARLVKISHATIRRIDRKAKIILGGLFAHPRQRPPKAYDAPVFLNRIYRVRGIKRSFEGVALHPYADDASQLRPYIRQIRRVMRRHRDARTPLYLTELGWGSGRGTAFEKGRRGQARQLTRAFALLRRMSRRARIKRIFWFSWEDVPNSCNFCDSTGLINRAGRAKPAWFRYRAFARGRR